MSTVSAQFKLKRRTAAQWATATTLAQGEPGFESDTGRLKIGTGTASWANLPYVSNVRTDTAANWATSSLVLGNGEIGYESNTGRMKVGSGTSPWTSLAYTSPFIVNDMMPLLGRVNANGGGVNTYGWGRRIILPAYKISQVEFYPTTQIFAAATSNNVARVTIYNSSAVGVVGSVAAQSYLISKADWNAAAAAGTSLRATLSSDFTPDGTSGYVVAYQLTNGHTSATPAFTLTGVTITAPSAISWTGSTGTITNGAQLISDDIIAGSVLGYSSGTTGTISNATYSSNLSGLTVRGYNDTGLLLGLKTMTDPTYITVPDVSTFFVGGNATISGAGTANNGSVTISAIDSAGKRLIVFKASMLPFLVSGATITPLGGSAVNITSILVPGTVKYVVSSLNFITVGALVKVAGTTGGFGNTGEGARVTSINSADTSFTISSTKTVSQAGAAGTAQIGANAATNIQSITQLTNIIDGNSERFYAFNVAPGVLGLTYAENNITSGTVYFKFLTTDAVTGSSSGDAVSALTLAAATSSVSTVTSVDALTRVIGDCNILIPSTVSVLKRQAEEFNLYNKNVVTGQWNQVGSLDYAGSVGKQLNECIRLEPSGYSTGTISGFSLTVRDYKWNTILSKSFSVNVVDTFTNTSAVRYLPIGDSFTHTNVYQTRVMGLNYISSPISSIGFSGSTVTVTVTSNAGMAVGDTVRIVGATTAGNDGSFTIATIAGSTQFTFTNASGAIQASASGVAVIRPAAASRVSAVTVSGGVATVTVGDTTGFTVGKSVTIAVYSPADVLNNVHGRIESVPNGTQFTVKNDRAVNAPVIVGSALVGNVITSGTRVDIRNSTNTAGNFGGNTGFSQEGRGGWALSTFYQADNTSARAANGFDSPFMFPTTLAGDVYRGNTEFWKRAVAVDKGATTLYRLSAAAPAAGTSVTVAGATNSLFNGTFTVVTSAGNDFTCNVPNSFLQGSSGGSPSVSWNSGANTANIVSIASLQYDYDGYGRASRDGLPGTTYAYLDSGYPSGSITTNWRVYDPLLSSMRVYNGSSWDTDGTTYTWGFDYSKYLLRNSWAFPSGFTPTHVSILLGANDYRSNEQDEAGAFATSIAGWITSYRAVVTSMKAASPSPTVIIALPTMGSSQDGFGNGGLGTLAERARRNLQTATKALLTEFDTAGDISNGIRVSAFGGGVDPIYGFSLPNAVAPNKYITDSSVFIRRATDEVHPSTAGYYQGGDFLAATIQSTRS